MAAIRSGQSQFPDLIWLHRGHAPALCHSWLSRRGGFCTESMPCFPPFCLPITMSCLADFVLSSSTAGLNAGSWERFPSEPKNKASALPSQPGKVGFALVQAQIFLAGQARCKFGVDLTHFLSAKEMRRDLQ